MAVWHSIGSWGQGKAFNASLTFERKEERSSPSRQLAFCFSSLPTAVGQRGLDQSLEAASSPAGDRHYSLGCVGHIQGKAGSAAPHRHLQYGSVMGPASAL